MTVNGGIFNYAGKASQDTENVINKEQNISYGQIRVDGVLYNDIEDYKEGKHTVIHSWIRNGDKFTCLHCNVTYEMGQEVDYIATGIESTMLQAENSGLNEMTKYPEATNIDENGNQTITKQEGIKWIVLGIENTDEDVEGINETLLITSKEPVQVTSTENAIHFYGPASYNNSESEINRICRELYSNNEYGKARGMTIEDINSVFNFIPTGGVYYDSNGNTFKTENFTTKLKELPANIWDGIKNNKYGTFTPDKKHSAEALGEYKLNGYSYSLNDDENACSSLVGEHIPITSIEKNIIFGENKEYKYNLASVGILCTDGAVWGGGCACFGNGTVLNGSVSNYRCKPNVFGFCF